jgi:hypothetical protein
MSQLPLGEIYEETSGRIVGLLRSFAEGDPSPVVFPPARRGPFTTW